MDHPCFDQDGGGNHFSHSLLIIAFSLYFDNLLDLVLTSFELGEIAFAFIVESCAMFTVSKRFLCILYPAVLICLLSVVHIYVRDALAHVLLQKRQVSTFYVPCFNSNL